jgi:hypothetical protein
MKTSNITDLPFRLRCYTDQKEYNNLPPSVLLGLLRGLQGFQRTQIAFATVTRCSLVDGRRHFVKYCLQPQGK